MWCGIWSVSLTMCRPDRRGVSTMLSIESATMMSGSRATTHLGVDFLVPLVGGDVLQLHQFEHIVHQRVPTRGPPVVIMEIDRPDRLDRLHPFPDGGQAGVDQDAICSASSTGGTGVAVGGEVGSGVEVGLGVGVGSGVEVGSAVAVGSGRAGAAPLQAIASNSTAMKSRCLLMFLFPNTVIHRDQSPSLWGRKPDVPERLYILVEG